MGRRRRERGRGEDGVGREVGEEGGEVVWSEEEGTGVRGGGSGMCEV